MVFLGHLFKKFLCKLVKCFFINGSQHFTFSFSLYTKIPFKYQLLMYRANLRFTCLLLTMCTRMKAFSVVAVPYSYNSTLKFFPNYLRCLISVEYFFFTLFLATSILYCFTVNIYNHLVSVIFLKLSHLFKMNRL